MESDDKKRKKLYIAGKISGDKDYQRKFHSAEDLLSLAGYDSANPARYVSKETSWGVAMRYVLGVMLRCDGVALLSDWVESKGAKIEERLASEVGIPVKPIVEWILEGAK